MECAERAPRVPENAEIPLVLEHMLVPDAFRFKLFESEVARYFDLERPGRLDLATGQDLSVDVGTPVGVRFVPAHRHFADFPAGFFGVKIRCDRLQHAPPDRKSTRLNSSHVAI